MFGTLHCNRQTNDVEFVERPDGLSKLEKHTACDRCRAKKVKCINQHGHCSRCKNLGKTCTFRVSEQGRLTKRRQRVPSIAHQDFLLDLSNQSFSPCSWNSKDGEQAQGNRSDRTLLAFSSPAEGEIMSGRQLPLEVATDEVSRLPQNYDMFLFDQFTEQIHNQDEENSTLPISPSPFFPTVSPDTSTELVHPKVYETNAQLLTPSPSSSNELLSSSQSTIQSSDINQFYEPGPDTTSTPGDEINLASSRQFSQGQAREPCQCLALAVFDLERCEASHNSASRAELDSIVACQKKAIKSCHSMLRCGTCMAKRENIYLWIVVIEKIVAACGQTVGLYCTTHSNKSAGPTPSVSLGCVPNNEKLPRTRTSNLDLCAHSAAASSFSSPSTPSTSVAGWQELFLGDYEISSITEWNHVVGVIVLLQFKMIMEIIAEMKCQATIILEETQKVKLEQSEAWVCELTKAMRCFQIE